MMCHALKPIGLYMRRLNKCIAVVVSFLGLHAGLVLADFKYLTINTLKCSIVLATFQKESFV